MSRILLNTDSQRPLTDQLGLAHKMSPFCLHWSPKHQVLNKSLIQFSQTLETKVNFYFPDEEQRRASMVKELGQVHMGSKSWAENSDPTWSVSKVHAHSGHFTMLPPSTVHLYRCVVGIHWSSVASEAPNLLYYLGSPQETDVILQQGK